MENMTLDKKVIKNVSSPIPHNTVNGATQGRVIHNSERQNVEYCSEVTNLIKMSQKRRIK